MTPINATPGDAKRYQRNLEGQGKPKRAKKPEEEYPGKCYRHHLRFKPNGSLENMCPACWWEREARKK